METSTKGSTAYCFSASAENDVMSNWLLDSGVTEHSVRDRESVSHVQNLTKPIKIRVAKLDTILIAKEVGEIEATKFVNNEQRKIVIKPVLIVPGLNNNLLSVRKLDKNGFKVIFENEVLAVAQIDSMGLYTFNLHPDSALALVAAEIETSHQRTGHLNYDSLKSLSRLVEGMDIKGNKKPEGVWEVYTKGKQTKHSVIKRDTERQDHYNLCTVKSWGLLI